MSLSVILLAIMDFLVIFIDRSLEKFGKMEAKLFDMPAKMRSIMPLR